MTKNSRYEYSKETLSRFEKISYKSGIESMICERLELDYYEVHINRPYIQGFRKDDGFVYVQILDWGTKYKESSIYRNDKYLFVDTVLMDYLFR
jgi:hypothetical protein